MNEIQAQSGSAKMRPRARLVSLIGEDLVSDEAVALVELVKNAYDADAQQVAVVFNSAEPTEVVVQDDGHGMTLDTVLGNWLEPGTIAKRDTSRSPGGRVFQGAKGIGRFASARLARSLLLETRYEGETAGTSLLMDWDQFASAQYLDEVVVDWEAGPLPDLHKGTRLVLSRLRKEWGYSDFERLHSRLSRLVSPFDDVVDFAIELEVPGHAEFSGDVQPHQLISEPHYRLAGRLDELGRFSGQIWHGREEAESFSATKLGGHDETPTCGAFELEVRVWDRDREGLDPLAQQLQISIVDVRRILDSFSGFSIYRDSFRVYPYGQRGNDWLNLDNRSRQNPVKRLANNQIVGAIRISRNENPGLTDRSTREGMILNEEHASLERWIVEVLALLEDFRYQIRPRTESSKVDKPLFEPFDLKDAVQQARGTLGKDHPMAELMASVETQVAEGVTRVQDVFSRLLMSAGLGQMVDLVIHEIGAPLGKINRQVSILEKRLEDEADEQLLAVASPMLLSIRGWLEQIHTLRQRLDPQTAGRRGRATTFDVGDEIDDTFALYEAVMEKNGITYGVKAPDGPIKVRMARSAVSQVLANLVDNSIFWMSRSGTGGKVEAILSQLENGFAIEISDDGPGIDPTDESQIFEPYFSKKPNGIGLGLYIARLVIEPYGKLTLRDRQSTSGANFVAEFERSVGR